MANVSFKVKNNQLPEYIAKHKISFPPRKKEVIMADTIEIIDPFQTPTPVPDVQAAPASPQPAPIPTVEMPPPVATPIVTSVIVASPSGHFPSLADNLQSELNDYLNRSKDAVNQILETTRSKAEFLETLAEKAKSDLEKEKHNITKVMG